MIKVAVVDDQPIILDGFIQQFYRARKEFNFDLVFTGTDAQQFCDFIENNGSQSVDLAIIDFKMSNMNGIELTKLINQKYPTIKSIIFSNYYSPELIEGALAIGAKSYLKKEIRYHTLFEALQEVYNNGYYFPDDFPLDMIQQVISSEKITPTHDFTCEVSQREKEIAILITKDKSYKEIGELINLSHRTVEDHKNNFCKKTGCLKAASITVYCHWMGWI